MKLPKANKIEAAVSKDPLRPAIGFPFIQNGRLIATDGKILASVPFEKSTEAEDVEEKRLPVEALKAARKLGGSKATVCHVRLNENRCEIDGGASYPLPTESAVSSIPRVGAIVEQAKKPNSEGTFTVTFDASFIARLADALGDTNLTFVFTKEDPLAIVTLYPEDRNGAFGLLMPRRTN